ncbi:hypothetical protein ACFFV7_51035 [Nonomuraea spiralis]|uniref:Uncharacterized protein n=1 Tax=Nonomuraea spiralis TaxID=46182 RepID=A0ABV5IYE7_9ACTN|nr:hypothetical protein [Nonomuraea spiralis]GGS88382.1 hypothetical protein GCM10010176_035190 [Nonomuraea spiralis]
MITLVPFSWEMLIAPASALAGVGITVLWTSFRETAKFHRELLLKHMDENREASAAYLTAVAALEQREAQLLHALAKRQRIGRDFTERELELQRATAELVADLRRSLATLDLLATYEVRAAARRIYDAHASLEDVLRDAWDTKQFDTEGAWASFKALEETREALVTVCRQQRAAQTMNMRRSHWARNRHLDDLRR